MTSSTAPSFYTKFQTDTDAETGEGVVLNYGELGKIRIHRAGGRNRRFTNLRQAKFKPYTRQLQNDTMDEDVARAIAIEVYAKTVIVGWDGVKGRDGNYLPFNEENVITLMTDLPDLFRDVQAAADDRSLFLADADKAAEGN
jgi:hypothetical protein